MGHPANSIIVEKGQFELYYTHWGANSLLTDLFLGPIGVVDVTAGGMKQMEITMIQKPLKWDLTYSFSYMNHTYTAKANRVIIPVRRKITLYREEEAVARGTETNFMYVLLKFVPFIKGFIPSKFAIQLRNSNVGQLIDKFDMAQECLEAFVHQDYYKIYEHTHGFEGNYYSIFKNGEQVGLVHKSPDTEWEAHTYKGKFDEDTDEVLNMLFMVFIDVLWNTVDFNNEIYSNTIEFEWGLDRVFGRKIDKKWEPKKK
jgi:hypothetical protein